MMLKVNDEFLDFNDFVEVEKRVKLFEKISDTLGDFSYQFTLSKTSHNLRILGYSFPDIKSKPVYNFVPTELMDESGLTIYRGALRVEKITDTIQASFFSGNFNWISLLGGALTELDLSDLDVPLNESEIVNSADNTEGVIFPVIDSGALITRGYSALMLEDFTGMIFVKTLLKRIFQKAGIKTNGDLFKDPIFDSLLLSKVTLGPEDIQSLSSYVRVDPNQVIVTPALSTTDTKIEFSDDTTYPYYDGSENAFDTTLFRYTAPVRAKVIVEGSIIQQGSPLAAASVVTKTFQIYKNGVAVYSKALNPLSSSPQTDGYKHILTLEIGDYIEGWVNVNSSFPADFTLTIFANSTFKVTPTFIYRTKGQSLVPNWTQGQLVSNILSLFCCITDYEPVTKTLTIDFFEGIKGKEPLDLSEYIQTTGTDYAEFISNFGKKSLLSYQESDADTIKEYNISQFVEYGAGVIDVANDFIENEAPIVESEFKAPISYLNSAFGASLERTEFVELEENGDQDFTGVTDASTEARFAVADATIYSVGELVRITESTNSGYNGDYIVKNVGVGFIHLRGLYFTTNATGVITKMLHRIGSDDGVYLFINTKYRIDNVSQFSTSSSYFIQTSVGNDYPNLAYAFFNMLNTGVPINDAYKQGLSFGGVNDPLSYQRTLIDKYWPTVGRVLNDPVKIQAIGHIPKIVFMRVTPLRPIRIKTELTNNLYYLNRIFGYKESYLPCEVDLIKLS